MTNASHFPDATHRSDEYYKPISVGSLNIRVMEPEGPYDHSVDVREEFTIVEFPCHSRKAKAKSKAGNETAPNLKATPSPVHWVRVDPDMEWAKVLVFHQSDSAWMNCLKGDREVGSQMAACVGLSRFTTSKVIDSLGEAMRDNRLFFRARCAAAGALLRLTDSQNNRVGLERFLAVYKDLYGYPQVPTLALKPLDFSNIGDYLLRTFIFAEIGGMSGDITHLSDQTKLADFLFIHLEEHDNSINMYDDTTYVSTLFMSCAQYR